MKYVIPLLLLATTSVQAQQPAACGDLKRAYNFLKKDYGEIPFIEMTDAQGGRLILFANPNTNTWTVIQTVGEDKMCALASGTNLRPADTKKLKEDLEDKGPPT